MRRALAIILPSVAAAIAVSFFLGGRSGERQPGRDPPVAVVEGPAGPGAQPSRTPAEAAGAGDSSPSTPALPAAGGSLMVRLTAAASGEPLAGVEASFNLRGAAARHSRTVTADGHGKVEVGGLPPDRYSLTSFAAGYLPDTRAVEVREGAVAEVEVQLQAGETLEGDVVDTSGAPLAGVQLRLSLAGAETPRNARAASGEDGAFIARGLEAGMWSLTAFKPGFRSRTLEVGVPAAGLRIELAADPGLEVAVVDGTGAPVQGARVFTPRRTRGALGLATSAITPADGKVRLSDLAEEVEELTIEVTHRAYLPWKRTFAARDVAGRVEVVLAEGVELSGRVRDGAGQPVAGADLRLLGPFDAAPDRLAAEAAGKSVNSTAVGEFAWKGLPPGVYELTASSPRSGSVRVSGIDLTGGGRTGLDLVLASRPGTIAGRIADREGQPIALCPVEVEAAGPAGGDGQPAPPLRTVSGRDGSFRFEALPAGGGSAYRLRAGGARWSRAVVEGIEAGNEQVAVLVERLGSLRGFVATPEGLDGFAVQVTRTGSGEGSAAFENTYRFPSRDRWFRIRDLEPGTYTVTLLAAGEAGRARRTASVVVLPGKEAGPVELGGE